jgi:hypothetical protein
MHKNCKATWSGEIATLQINQCEPDMQAVDERHFYRILCTQPKLSVEPWIILAEQHAT